MRQQLQNSEINLLRHDLSTAVAEEDYDRAETTQLRLQHTENNTPAFSGSGLKYLDWAWLESDLDTRVFLRGFHSLVMQSAIEARVAGSIIHQKS